MPEAYKPVPEAKYSGDMDAAVDAEDNIIPFRDAKTRQRLIQSSSEFIKDFKPPDYLIKGLIQRRFFYSITARTGSGKTAICLRLAAHVGRGLPLGKRDVCRGRVLYFAGENPDDIRMRWIAMLEQLGEDPVDVHFVTGHCKLSAVAAQIRAEAEQLGELVLVIVDTSAAYFEGTDENDNVQALAHARRLRELVDLPGGPAVIACCHPPKKATDDNLIPRGGGAFLAEVDGNFDCRKSGSVVSLHTQGKFRGPEFAPILFQLDTVTHPRLKDSGGDSIPTIVASPLTEEKEQELAKAVGQTKHSPEEGRLSFRWCRRGARSCCDAA